MRKNIYGEHIDYDALEQRVYKEEGNEIFYVCPLCGGEYLDTFITKSDGQTMCIDCWTERNGDQ